jgi:hypothetical protein
LQSLRRLQATHAGSRLHGLVRAGVWAGRAASLAAGAGAAAGGRCHRLQMLLAGGAAAGVLTDGQGFSEARPSRPFILARRCLPDGQPSPPTGLPASQQRPRPRCRRRLQDVLWRMTNSVLGFFKADFMETTAEQPDLWVAGLAAVRWAASAAAPGQWLWPACPCPSPCALQATMGKRPWAGPAALCGRLAGAAGMAQDERLPMWSTAPAAAGTGRSGSPPPLSSSQQYLVSQPAGWRGALAWEGEGGRTGEGGKRGRGAPPALKALGLSPSFPVCSAALGLGGAWAGCARCSACSTLAAQRRPPAPGYARRLPSA